jgi:hypothetical protein
MLRLCSQAKLYRDEAGDFENAKEAFDKEIQIRQKLGMHLADYNPHSLTHHKQPTMKRIWVVPMAISVSAMNAQMT